MTKQLIQQYNNRCHDRTTNAANIIKRCHDKTNDTTNIIKNVTTDIIKGTTTNTIKGTRAGQLIAKGASTKQVPIQVISKLR